jgi:hypothetical protein
MACAQYPIPEIFDCAGVVNKKFPEIFRGIFIEISFTN